MALMDAKTAAQLEPLGLKLFANVSLGHIDPQLIAKIANVTTSIGGGGIKIILML